MHQVQFSDLKQLHFKVRRYLVEVNENGRKTEKEVIQGRKRGKCRKGYFENGINNIMTSYDYKTLLRLSNPLMSTQTQTPWLIAGWINVSQGKPQILMNWQKQKHSKLVLLIKKLLIV